MQANGEKFAPPALTPFAAKDRHIIRRAQSGVSGDEITAEQQQYIDDWCRAELGRIDSDVPYDALWVQSDSDTPET